MDGVAVRLECHRAILVPFQEQCPVIRVIAPKISQTVYTLVVAEPAAIPAGCFVAWEQHIVVLTIEAAQAFANAELLQGCPLAFIQLTKPGRLVRCDTQIFHDISFLAPRGALCGEGEF